MTETLIREVLYADDCTLSAHNLDDIQVTVDRFADAAKEFGPTVSIKQLK